MQPSKFIIPGRLKYKTGDATVPESAGHRIIVHVCNDVGAFGAGFAKAVAKRWPAVKNKYNLWHRSQNKFIQGEIQEVRVQSDTIVVNMLAQEGLISKENPTPINYDSLKQCLSKAALLAVDNGSSIHMPRIGCGLAGGSWNKIEKIIIDQIIERGVNVTVYDLPENK